MKRHPKQFRMNLFGNIENETAKSLPECKAVTYEVVHVLTAYVVPLDLLGNKYDR
jgi:hypothetical protein